MENKTLKLANPHKYNVGDEITVKIAIARERNGIFEYRIKGAENIQFKERTMEKMVVKKPMPGDIAYGVDAEAWDEIVALDAYRIEDIGHHEVKISGDWFPIDDGIFFDEESAEQKAIELAKERGFKIVKGGLFKEADNAGRG